jgi:hypothetical protein
MNWRIFIASQFFWLLETAYFGWNLAPQSDAEMICDGIVVIMLCMSWIKMD